MTTPRHCSVDDCQDPHKGRGLCNKHLKRLRKTGTTEALDTPATRFWAKVDKSGDCWVWTAGKDTHGYGLFKANGTQSSSHRVSYAMANGPIPEGMKIDHRCHNRACVRPVHLRLATTKQNAENVSGAQSGSTSGIRGVTWHKGKGRWQAQAKHDSKSYFGGLFVDRESAGAAAVELRNRLFTHNDADRAPQMQTIVAIPVVAVDEFKTEAMF